MSPTKSPNKVLAKMLDRLFAGLMSGPGMNCRPHKSRQRIDLTQLAKLQDISPNEILKNLLAKEGECKIVAKVKLPKKSEADDNNDEPSPKEKAWDDQTTLLNKLRVVVDDAKTYEQDTGVHVLNVGFPLLSLPPGSFDTGSRNSSKRILAPIAFIPITLTIKRGTSPAVELACRGEGVDLVSPNTALLAWLEQQTGKLQQSEIFADDTGENPWKEITDLVTHVSKALGIPVPPEFLPKPIEPTENAEVKADPESVVPKFDLKPALRVDDESEAPAILLSAVLGLFPTAKQGLLRDTQAMLAESINPSATQSGFPVDAFLNAGVDFDAPPAPLFESQQLPVEPLRRNIATDRLATAADPCQARAVALARDTRGLVIHGPPGTGKSQTITNIIADHLSRGQRVLLVCEKRTALDVVADRLEHMGLRSLCGIVHDPQRDQRDLYRAIRQQLDELPEITTDADAESKLAKAEQEIRKVHESLTKYHQSLMTKPAAGGPSFHELMGQWMAISPADNVRITDESAHAISPDDFNSHRNDLLNVLQRAQRVEFSRNTWAKCAGISLQEFLNRPMDAIRTALDRVATAASSADAALDDSIPPFSSAAALPLQGHARAEVAERWAALLPNLNATVLSRWLDRDAADIRSAREKITEIASFVDTFRNSSLQSDLKNVTEPSLPQIAQQLRAMDAYLEVAGRWYAIFSFGAKSEATKALKPWGLPTTPTEASRLKQHLLALRARLTIQQVRTELSETHAEKLPADDVLERFLSQHTELFDLLMRFREDPTLQGLAKPASALANTSTADRFIEGLRKSPARATAITALEDELQSCSLFESQWLAALGIKLRNNKSASETTAALKSELDSLEGVLRTREARTALPKYFEAADQMLAQSFDPEESLRSLQKSVLAGEIQRRLRSDSNLLGTDTHQIESNFVRYRQLDAEKKKLVRDAIQHQWITKQKKRLLSMTGNKKSSAGAELQSRLLMRGERAIRLRQVISVGEKLPEGDPLFDVCPVWMASPETVAQVFPRKSVFDVIVFDEASQCRLEEALPVLTRGQRVVIAGDPKQLPPTRFFESAVVQSEEEEPETEQEMFEARQSEVEDLLGAALNLSIQQCYLDVHYRSRNEDLIGFSNHNFYGDRLQAIPGHPNRKAKQAPVKLYAENGVYANRKNEPEAERIVQIVKELLSSPEVPSIGIACFNLAQRDLIVEKLDDAAGEDAQFARQLAEARTRKGRGSFEGLFVKNLENVQGDERDHMIISTTYGPDARGKFYRRFGPLALAGGGRRLNVLVTRARQQVHLVSSIPAEAYRNLPNIPEGQTAGGGWLLFAYLKYAEDLAKAYAESKNESAQVAPAEVQVLASESPSTFAVELGKQIARDKKLGSTVHWGNDGFCVDLAIHHPARPGDVTVGVLCDSSRFKGADDLVEWDIFRTGILADQGWTLRRVWTPHFFRDQQGTLAAVFGGS